MMLDRSYGHLEGNEFMAIPNNQNPKKKTYKLERDLMDVLIDPEDGDQRKRYVKKWTPLDGLINSKVKPVYLLCTKLTQIAER